MKYTPSSSQCQFCPPPSTPLVTAALALVPLPTRGNLVGFLVLGACVLTVTCRNVARLQVVPWLARTRSGVARDVARIPEIVACLVAGSGLSAHSTILVARTMDRLARPAAARLIRCGAVRNGKLKVESQVRAPKPLSLEREKLRRA